MTLKRWDISQSGVREKRDLLEINTIAKMKILKKRLGDKVAKIFRKNKDKYKDKKTR